MIQYKLPVQVNTVVYCLLLLFSYLYQVPSTVKYLFIFDVRASNLQSLYFHFYSAHYAQLATVTTTIPPNQIKLQCYLRTHKWHQRCALFQDHTCKFSPGCSKNGPIVLRSRFENRQGPRAKRELIRYSTFHNRTRLFPSST